MLDLDHILALAHQEEITQYIANIKIYGTPKMSKYIENLVGLIILKKSGTNFSNTRDP